MGSVRRCDASASVSRDRDLVTTRPTARPRSRGKTGLASDLAAARTVPPCEPTAVAPSLALVPTDVPSNKQGGVYGASGPGMLMDVVLLGAMQRGVYRLARRV